MWNLFRVLTWCKRNCECFKAHILASNAHAPPIIFCILWRFYTQSCSRLNCESLTQQGGGAVYCNTMVRADRPFMGDIFSCQSPHNWRESDHFYNFSLHPLANHHAFHAPRGPPPPTPPPTPALLKPFLGAKRFPLLKAPYSQNEAESSQG